MATRTAPTPPPASPPTPDKNRFFDWMRGLGIPRQRGWVGGVCAGVAERLGIDPIIVRGIAVVVAVLGGPALLLYAAAWLLLPDADDRIHLERLIKGDFDPANIGIGALVVLSLLPVTQGFWYLGASYWSEPYWTGSFGRALWTVLLLTGSVIAIVWVAKRARHTEPPVVVPATTDARPETVPEPPSASDEVGQAGVASATAGSAVGQNPPAPPAHPAADAPPEDLAAWREQQERWKTEHAAWKQQQSASERELRDQRTAANHQRAVANAAIADERRRLRRMANPRVSGSQVVITLGAALLVGGIAALASQSGDGWRGYGVTVGLAAATITVALSAIFAGLFRRRSGFLGFVALLLVSSTVLVSFVPPDRTLAGVAYNVALENSGRYSQLVGNFGIGSINTTQGDASTIDLWQGAGSVYIEVPDGMTVRVEATTGNLQWGRTKNTDGGSTTAVVPTPFSTTADGRRNYDLIVGSGKPTVTVHVWQGNGYITIDQQPPVVNTIPTAPATPNSTSPEPTSPAPTSPDTGANQ
jgi:phage shock protein PspC (stress-responsive transcriptional regulator)